MPSLRSLLSTTLPVIACLVAQPIAAQPFPSQTAPQETYRRAHEAMNAKNWNEARRLLLELWGQAETYDVAASLGQVEYELGKYASGARYMAFAVAHIPPKERPETVERFKAAFAELKAHIGTVKVSVRETDAEVRVDGAVVGSSPLPSDVFVDAGAHVFEARSADGRRAEAKIDVVGGGTYTVELTPIAAAGAGIPPAQDQARPTNTPQPPPNESTPRGKSMVPIYITGGIAVTGLALGVGFTLAASGTSDDINALGAAIGSASCAGSSAPSECSDLRDALETRDSQRNISYVSFGVAGAAIATGIIYLLWPEDAPAATVGATWLPNGGALVTLRGSL
jgi:hypothetical protein